MYDLLKLFESTCKYSHSTVSAGMILLAFQSISSEYLPESSLGLHMYLINPNRQIKTAVKYATVHLKLLTESLSYSSFFLHFEYGGCVFSISKSMFENDQLTIQEVTV